MTRLADAESAAGPAAACGPLAATAFFTPLGWMAICWTAEHKVLALSFARATEEQALDHLRAPAQRWLGDDDCWRSCDPDQAPAAIAELIERLAAFASGEGEGDFSDVPVEISDRTPFQQRVLRACQRIEPGETISYGELARRAGSPRASRAVGQVMSSNRVPLVIPCHRVVGRDGALHGFSAPQGLAMKRRLLQLEGV